MTATHTTQRNRLPNSRRGYTQKGQFGNHEYYVTVNFYEGDEYQACTPGEVFVRIAKEGSTLAGLFDGICVAISVGWQYGVPWEVLRTKYLGMYFGGEFADPKFPSILHHFALVVDEVLAARKEELKVINEPPPKPE